VDKPPSRRTVVDPAVADMLADMERKKRISQLPKPQQGKARKNAARHKAGLDLPPTLHEELRKIAEQEHISISSLVTFCLYRGVADYAAGEIELGPYKRLSRCARFEYVLDFTKLDKL
jgi:hypothetical protein